MRRRELGGAIFLCTIRISRLWVMGTQFVEIGVESVRYLLGDGVFFLYAEKRIDPIESYSVCMLTPFLCGVLFVVGAGTEKPG